MKLTIENLVGLLVSLMAYVAVWPLLNTAIQYLMPNMGEVSSLILRMLPFILLWAVISGAIEEEEKR